MNKSKAGNKSGSKRKPYKKKGDPVIKFIPNTHNLSNKNIYPHFHIWVTMDCINIYSTVKIVCGDRVMIGKDLAVLGRNTEITGNPSNTKYYPGEYYEFTYQIINK